MQGKKLSDSVSEDLKDLLITGKHRAVLHMMQAIVYNMGTNVLKFDLKETKFTTLALKKAEYDGAKSLLVKLEQELQTLKQKIKE